jgi:ferritin-like metal-binding protein YciE
MSWFEKILGIEMTLDNLETVLEMQLNDLHSAETQLISALPKMAQAASSSALAGAFRSHLAETRQHKSRLEKAFRLMGKRMSGEKCDAMAGLISEGQEVIDMDGDSGVKDAALIAAAQRVEHYEIAGYGCARTFARRLQKDGVAKLLNQTLAEEAKADRKLTQIAERSVNRQAARANRHTRRQHAAVKEHGHAMRRPARHRARAAANNQRNRTSAARSRRRGAKARS